MNHPSKNWLILLGLIVVAYLFIDRPLCQFIYDQGCSQYLEKFLHNLLAWLPMNTNTLGESHRWMVQIIDWPPLMAGLSPFILLVGIMLSPSRMKTLLILMGISILLTFVIKNDLKWIFSRDWPMTWVNNNPSWISNHAYGFHWFQGKIFQANDTAGSFPSGHTAIAFASLLPIGLLFPKTLSYCLALATLEGLFMIFFDYHFLSDVLAGAGVGIVCTLAVNTIMQPSKIASPPA